VFSIIKNNLTLHLNSKFSYLTDTKNHLYKKAEDRRQNTEYKKERADLGIKGSYSDCWLLNSVFNKNWGHSSKGKYEVGC
jgi:hypothetical protein